MVRRHARGGEGPQQHYGPALQTVSGNYLAAKRKGVVAGVDYQLTGVVRFVQADAVRRQLSAGCVVLLSNLGYSAAGEVLNCDIYTGKQGSAAQQAPCQCATSISGSQTGSQPPKSSHIWGPDALPGLLPTRPPHLPPLPAHAPPALRAHAHPPPAPCSGRPRRH